jgi:glutamate racemase
MTVAQAVEQALPDFRLVYFGDLARAPYGSKSPETITRYARQNTDFLLAHGAKLIIIACNSAASVASDLLKNTYDVPMFEVITPAIHSASKASASSRIGVIGTRATIKSGVYEEKIRQLLPEARVHSQACPLLVPLVEEGWLNKRETKMIVRRYLHHLRLKQVDTLVLGCTHYPLLKHLIQPRIGKAVKVIDSSAAVAAELRLFLENSPEFAQSLARDGENVYYVSDVTDAALSTAQRIFGRRIDLRKATF